VQDALSVIYIGSYRPRSQTPTLTSIRTKKTPQKKEKGRRKEIKKTEKSVYKYRRTNKKI